MTTSRRPSGAFRAPARPSRPIAIPELSGAPAGGVPAAVGEALLDLAAALQKHGTYPPGHPMLAPAVDRVAASLGRALAGRAALVVGVVAGRVTVDGAPLAASSPTFADLALRLQRRELGGLRVLAGVGRDEIAEALAAVAGAGERDGPPARRHWPHLRLALAHERRPSGSVPVSGAGAPTPETLALWQRLTRDDPPALPSAELYAARLDAARGLPPRDAVLVVRAAARVAGRAIAPSHGRLLDRLADHERAAPDDDDVRRAFRSALLAAIASLDAADHRVAADRSCALAEDGDAARLLRISLDVGVVSGATERAADELVAREGPTALLAIVGDAEACTADVRALLGDRVLSVDALRRALAMPAPHWAAMERLVSVLGGASAPPLVDALVDAPSRSRQYAITRVMRACPHVSDEIAERLGSAVRATQRVLLHALREVGGHAPLDAARFVRHPDAALRSAAARTLLASPPDAARARRDALRSDDPHLVRLGVRAALRRSCADDAAPLRSAAANAELHVAVRCTALRALGAHEDMASRACLLDAARRAATARRRGAEPEVEALGATALRVLATHWSSDPDARATLDLARSGANRVLRAAAGGAR